MNTRDSHLQPSQRAKMRAGLKLGLAVSFGLTLALGLILAFGAGLVQANHPGGLQIGLAGTSQFFMDSNDFCVPPGVSGPDGMWLPVIITNTTAAETYTGLQLVLTPPLTTTADDPVRYLGNLGPGQTTSIFYFLDYRVLRTLAACAENFGANGEWYIQPYTLTLTSLDGSLSAPRLFTDTFETTSMISAAAGGNRISDLLGPGAAVGQVLTQSVVYDFGNNPAGDQLFLQPTGNGNFSDQCFRLVGSNITASNVPGVSVGTEDVLFFPSTDTANGDQITVEYQWLILCSPGTTTQTFPWAEMTSGTQLKYDGNGYVPTTFPLPIPATNVVSATKSITPSNLPVGGVATYTVQFTNSFTQPIYLTQITDVLPSGVVFGGVVNSLSNITATNSTISPTVGATGALRWFGIPFPSNSASYLIPASSNIKLVYTATITSTPGSYTNFANGVVGNEVVGPVSATVTVGSADLSITKSDNPDPVVAGQTLTYTLVVSNAGPADATGVVVTDTLPAGVTLNTVASSQGGCVALPCSLGTVTAGSTASVTVTVTVNLGASGTLTNTATAGSSTPDPDPTNNSDTEPTVVNSSADLSIVKSDTPDPVNASGTLTYTLTLTNNGPSAASAITVTDTLPVGVTFVSASGTGWSCAQVGGVVTCTRAGLAVGVGPGITIVVTAPASGGVITNTVSITSTTADPAPGNNGDSEPTTIMPQADLAISKVSTPNPITPGQTITYTIVVSNAGPSPVSAITVTDNLPAAILGPVYSPSAGSFNTATGAWTGLTLGAGGRITLTIVGTVDPTFTGTMLINTAVVTTPQTTDPDPTDNTDGDTNTVLNPAIDVAKSVTPSPNVPSSTVTYTINITNTGTFTFTTVALTDTLPTGFTFVPGSAVPPVSSVIGNVLVWNNLGVLLPGQSTQVSFAAQVVPAITGTFTNTAAAAGTHLGGTVTDTDDAPLFVTDPTVELAKNLLPPGVVNGLITFTITLTNTGPSVLDVAPLRDLFSGLVVYVGGTPPADMVDNSAGVLTWNDLTLFFGNMDPGEVFVVNTVFSLTTTASTFSMTNTAIVSQALDIFDNRANEDTDTEFITNAPTAVELLYFNVGQQGTEVLLSWATAVEIDNYGFRILRSTTGQLTDAVEIAFMPGQGHGTANGASYSYVDQAVTKGQTYTYWLVDVDFNGQETYHGPITVNVGATFDIYLPIIKKD